MKNGVDDLALFGGTPGFAEVLHVGRPNIGNREALMSRISDLLDRRWLTNNGPFVQELEEKIAKLVGVKHCIAMCNATIALEIAIRALGLKGEVIIPSFTFVATAHALQWQEITPVFCDIDPATHTIDPGKIERLITPRTSAVIGVHIWGHVCDIEAIEEICRRRDLHLIFDAAHALGGSYRGRMVGGFGEAEVFSFHATKFFNTFEGGAVTTNNDEIAAKIRLMKNFGFAGYDNVIHIGTNGKMPEISAAMGLTSLESMHEFIATNQQNYKLYGEELAGLRGIKLMAYDEDEACNYQYIVLEVDSSKTKITRDHLIQLLWAENVMARRYFHPGCHRMEPYRSYFPQAGQHLEITEAICERVLVLPNGTAVDHDQIRSICQIIRFAIENAPAVVARLSQAQPPITGADMAASAIAETA